MNDLDFAFIFIFFGVAVLPSFLRWAYVRTAAPAGYVRTGLVYVCIYTYISGAGALSNVNVNS